MLVSMFQYMSREGRGYVHRPNRGIIILCWLAKTRTASLENELEADSSPSWDCGYPLIKAPFIGPHYCSWFSCKPNLRWLIKHKDYNFKARWSEIAPHITAFTATATKEGKCFWKAAWRLGLEHNKWNTVTRTKSEQGTLFVAFLSSFWFWDI